MGVIGTDGTNGTDGTDGANGGRESAVPVRDTADEREDQD